VGTEHAEHLKACIEKHYEISYDWKGSTYCGLKLYWDYEKKIVDLSMPGYIKAALQKFQHPDPTRPEDAQHTWKPQMYGAKPSSLRLRKRTLFFHQNM
jgi:endonuclease I